MSYGTLASAYVLRPCLRSLRGRPSLYRIGVLQNIGRELYSQFALRFRTIRSVLQLTVCQASPAIVRVPCWQGIVQDRFSSFDCPISVRSRPPAKIWPIKPTTPWSNINTLVKKAVSRAWLTRHRLPRRASVDQHPGYSDFCGQINIRANRGHEHSLFVLTKPLFGPV